MKIVILVAILLCAFSFIACNDSKPIGQKPVFATPTVAVSPFDVSKPDIVLKPSAIKDARTYSMKRMAEQVSGYVGHISGPDIKSDQATVEGFLNETARMDNSDLQINVVLQAHHNPSKGIEYPPEAIESQKRISSLLGYLKPDVFVLEGFYNNLNVGQRIEYTRQVWIDMDPTTKVTFEELRPIVQSTIDQNSGYLYQRANPTVKVFGSERKSLMMLQVVAHRMRDLDPKFTSLFDDALRLRSEYAVATAIKQMRQLGKKEIILIIGANHGLDMPDIVRQYGIQINLYLALTNQDRQEFAEEIRKRK